MGTEGEGQQKDIATVRAYVLVRGIVQGVGFRPFVHRIAHAHQLAGWVLNSTEGVEIEVEGLATRIDAFLDDLSHKAPPLASIHRIDIHYLPPAGYSSFIIETSHEATAGFPLVSPDIATCPDCLSELFDAHDRRHRYPFINCTNCGPRFTIVEGVPYDRPKTTMKAFAMCPTCRSEYDDPTNRRFHAQPNACPECGPTLWLEPTWTSQPHRGPTVSRPTPARRDALTLTLSQREREQAATSPSGREQSATSPSGREQAAISPSRRGRPSEARAGEGAPSAAGSPPVLAGLDPIGQARTVLKSGQIIAVKGLGGFHLACDATNADAVRRLRGRKRRVEKPFAIMVRDLETVEKLCYLGGAEAQLLSSARRPIVLLERRSFGEGAVAQEVAPQNKRLGVMLPYTPVHHLLLDPAEDVRFDALVMTSGNLSEEPIAKDNDEALFRLAALADYFLLHDRPIHLRCDDSVTQVFAGKETVIRRSRGYAPLPMRLDFEAEPVLACGAELKNTFCLAEGNYAFLSQHIGDLENQETLDFFTESIDHFIRVFNLSPRVIAHDLHPDYLSTRYALSRRADLRASASALSTILAVQHHHAHIASCMAENGLSEQVIGIAFDGTGYGSDGAIWGGEFLVADFATYRRVAHLRYIPLPGGEAAIKKPYRMAISYLLSAFGGTPPQLDFVEDVDPRELAALKVQLARRINSPSTSSCGRLFDAVSALLGIRDVITYEGQAAIELEMAASAEVEDAYEFSLCDGLPMEIDCLPVIRSIVADLQRGLDVDIISAKFHNGLAAIIATTSARIREATGLNKVCLSGGVFQNRFLLQRTLEALRCHGFEPFIHHQVPCNDGGISLGQAVVATARIKA